MLTVHQIVKLFESGVSVKSKQRHSKHFLGVYDHSQLEISIYEAEIKREARIEGENLEKQRGVTILHEFVHARDDCIQSARSPKKRASGIEREVDKEAMQTYNTRPYVLEFIKRLYSL